MAKTNKRAIMTDNKINELYYKHKGVNVNISRVQFIAAVQEALAIKNKPIDWGWDCPTSPTGKCEYAEDDIMEDCCIHCGEPEERK